MIFLNENKTKQNKNLNKICILCISDQNKKKLRLENHIYGGLGSVKQSLCTVQIYPCHSSINIEGVRLGSVIIGCVLYITTHQEGFTVFAIAIGNNLDLDALRDVATNASFVSKVDSFTDLQNFLPSLQSSICFGNR